MSFENLVSVAFLRGAGVSAEAAYADERFATLLKTAASRGSPNPYALAAVTYLGELLADRAFHNLPAMFRSRAEKWKHDHVFQSHTLQLFMQHLHYAGWLEAEGRKGKTFHYNKYMASVLPAAMGDWDTGWTMPNCLGVVQLLIGFARAVGAPHFMVNVTRNYQVHNIAYELDILQQLLTTLTSVATYSQEMARAIQRLQKAVESRHQDYEAVALPQIHHALLIQLEDRTWHIVDPYMMSTYLVAVDFDFYDAIASFEPGSEAVFETLPPTHRTMYHEGLLMRLQALQYMCELATRRFRSAAGSTQKGYILKDVATIVAYTGDQVNYSESSLRILIDQLEEGQERGWPPPESVRELVEESVRHRSARRPLDDRLREVRSNAAYQRRAVWRLIALHLHNTLDRLNNAYVAAETREHYSIEVGDPRSMLGVATLNHLWSFLPGRLHGLLAVLNHGQGVLANTLCGQQEGDPIAPEYVPHIRSVDALKRRDPLTLIPQLHPFTQ